MQPILGMGWQMVNHIQQGGLPPGQIPNVNCGPTYFINELLRNGRHSIEDFNCDSTDFSHHRKPAGGRQSFFGQLKGLVSDVWNSTPGWIKWPILAAGGLYGWNQLGRIPNMYKWGGAAAAAVVGWLTYTADAPAHNKGNCCED